MPTILVNMDDKHNSALIALAREKEMSKTQVMLQALRLYQVVQERSKEGQQLAFIKDGKTVPLLIPTMLPLLPVD